MNRPENLWTWQNNGLKLTSELMSEKYNENNTLKGLWKEEKHWCEQSYYQFFLHSWGQIEPATQLVNNWHVKYLCSELQSQAERIAAKKPKEYDLIINIPPRSLKSTICTILFQPWVWTRWPNLKFITASYSGDLALEHAVKSRRLIQTLWYQRMWDNITIVSDQNVKSHFENDQSGHRIATSVGGSATGQGGDFIICDDPLSAQQGQSDAYRKAANDWWTTTMHTRLNDMKVGVRIIVMQRLHEDDLTGHVLELDGTKYKHICLPGMESQDISPPEVKKKYVEGLFFPKRFDMDYMDDTKKKMGSYQFAGQIQQRPSPDEGGVFKRWWWRYWVPRGQLDQYPPIKLKNTEGKEFHAIIEELPERHERHINSWDMSFKDLEENDYVAGGHWAKAKEKLYLIEQDHGQYDFVKTCERVEFLYKRSGQPSAVYIEEKANGPAVISSMKRKIPSIIGVNPKDSKTARAMPYSVQVENGNIYLPHPDYKPWVHKFIDEHAVFPLGLHDDQVDESSQAVDKLVGAERVWEAYNPDKLLNDKKPAKRYFNVNWTNITDRSTATFSALYMDKNYSISGLFTVWDMSLRKLFVHHEFVMKNPTAESITPLVRKWGQVHYSSRVFGSKDMFGEGKTISNLLNKFKIRLRENVNYDENGSILMANKMFKLGMIIVHTACPIFDRQVLTWEIEKDKPQKKGVGLCMCLANIVSALRNQGKLSPIQVPPPYTKYRQRRRQQLKTAKTMLPNTKSHQDFLLG